MRLRQKQEIETLNKIINDGTISKWDGIYDGVRLFDKGVSFLEGSDERINPEQVYFKINGGGQNGFITGSKDEFVRINRLLKAKERYDLMMNMWIEDIKGGLMSLTELHDDGFVKEARIIANKLDIMTICLWTAGDFIIHNNR